jgi:hypothetical protein
MELEKVAGSWIPERFVRQCASRPMPRVHHCAGSAAIYVLGSVPN